MPFTPIAGLAHDRIHKVIALDPNSSGDNEILFILTQCSEANIDITSTSRDITDKDGTVIKTIYTGKSGTLSITNAFMDINILGIESGSDIEKGNKFNVPFVKDVKVKDAKTSSYKVTIEGTLDEESVQVVGESASGNMVKAYEKNTASSASQFAVSGNEITLPTVEPNNNDGVAKFVIYGTRTTENVARVVNYSDKFPETCTLLLQCLGYDPCDVATKKAYYIRIPSAQISPDHSLNMNEDSTLQFTANLQTAYCSEGGDKVLYEAYFPSDDAVAL